MALNKYKIGELIKQRKEKYNGIDELPIRGVTREGFIPPKQLDADTSLYNVFYKGDFVFNPARMELNSIAYNSDFEKAMCSSLYEIFYVVREDLVLPEYLNLFIKRMEFARKCWFLAIGSARNYFRIPDLSELEIELPSIEIQKKYIAIYDGLKKNLKVYQSKLEEIRLTLDGFIDTIDKSLYDKIGNYIELNDKRNSDGNLTEEDIKGFNADGYFITPMRTFSGEIKNFRIISKGDFVYNPRIPTVTYPVALNLGKDLLVSPAYVTFNIAKKDLLDDEYFLMLQQRKNFSRKILFNTWGSSTPFLRHEDLCDITIPIPDMKIQKSLTSIFRCYLRRKEIVEKLKEKINNICPILIRGAVKEAKNG